MKRVLFVLALLTAITALTAWMWGNTTVCINSRQGNDEIDWSQLGFPGILVISPFTVHNTSGLEPIKAIGHLLPNGQGMVGIEAKKTTFPFFWGDFAKGDTLLLSDFLPPPVQNNLLKLQFLHSVGCSSTGISQAGAQIDPLYVQTDSATITAYGQAFNVLGSCTISVTNLRLENNSAPYLGIKSVDSNSNPVPDIYYVQFSMDNGFALNRVSVDVPEPAKSCVLPPNSTMVAWYPFDEPIGASKSADLAMGNVGTWSANPPVPVCGEVRNALSFNGIDQYVEAPSTIVTNFGPNGGPTVCSGPGSSGSGTYSTCPGDFSIDTWIQVAPGAPSSPVVIVDKRVGSPPNIHGYAFYLDSHSRPN